MLISVNYPPSLRKLLNFGTITEKSAQTLAFIQFTFFNIDPLIHFNFSKKTIYYG